MPGTYAASYFRVVTSSILESWLGRAQAKDLRIRLDGARAGFSFAARSRSFVRSLVRSWLVRSFVRRSFVHSFVHSLVVRAFVRSLVPSLVRSCARSCVRRPFARSGQTTWSYSICIYIYI